MRATLACLLAGTALLAACSPKPEAADKSAAAPAASPVAALTGPPKPRAGVWESTMTMTTPAPMKVTSSVCLDEATIAKDGWVNNQNSQTAGVDCTQSVQGSLTGYSFKSSCKIGDRTVISEGRATGDFSKAYTMDITSRMEPAPPGMPPENKMTVSARYVGPCPAGQAAGMIPGSMKMSPGG